MGSRWALMLAALICSFVECGNPTILKQSEPSRSRTSTLVARFAQFPVIHRRLGERGKSILSGRSAFGSCQSSTNCAHGGPRRTRARSRARRYPRLTGTACRVESWHVGTRTLNAGDGFQVPTRVPHGGKNGDKPTILAVTYVVEKGAQAVIPSLRWSVTSR
jgi:hypothetical protein